MMSQKRLQLLQNHICANQTAATPAASSSKTLISAQIIKDGAKEYPEIIDYHPEKKVSSTDFFIVKSIKMHFLIPILSNSIYMGVFIQTKLDYINKQGWGYKDTEF